MPDPVLSPVTDGGDTAAALGSLERRRCPAAHSSNSVQGWGSGREKCEAHPALWELGSQCGCSSEEGKTRRLWKPLQKVDEVRVVGPWGAVGDVQGHCGPQVSDDRNHKNWCLQSTHCARLSAKLVLSALYPMR